MLLESSFLSIITTILVVFQVLVCILLILVVMMQRPKQEGLGAAFGGDTMDSLTGAHATDFLQKGTAFLGTLLFVITFALSMLVVAGNASNTSTITKGAELAQDVAVDDEEAELLEQLETAPENVEGEAPAKVEEEISTTSEETPASVEETEAPAAEEVPSEEEKPKSATE